MLKSAVAPGGWLLLKTGYQSCFFLKWMKFSLAKGLLPYLDTGMNTARLLPTTHPSELNCVSVNNLEMRRAVADINAISYNSLATFREALELDRFWQETAYGTVGYVEDRPVSTATTFSTEDEFYLALVATLPDYRNRGYARAVIRHSLEQAAQRYGKKRTALHATPIGIPLYQEMGYQPTAYFGTYS